MLPPSFFVVVAWVNFSPGSLSCTLTLIERSMATHHQGVPAPIRLVGGHILCTYLCLRLHSYDTKRFVELLRSTTSCFCEIVYCFTAYRSPTPRRELWLFSLIFLRTCLPIACWTNILREYFTSNFHLRGISPTSTLLGASAVHSRSFTLAPACRHGQTTPIAVYL